MTPQKPKPLDAKKAPVIRVVRKRKAEARHGGQWKVAYADFVTAMMAFFLVMWIISQDENVKQVIEAYFNNPLTFREDLAGQGGVLPGGTPVPAPHLRTESAAARDDEEELFQEVRRRIREKLGEMEGLRAMGLQVDAHIDIYVTDQGLRIEIIEAGTGETFFPFGSARLTRTGETLLAAIAPELDNLQHSLVLEGHTDAARYRRTDYSNWELSVERANAARRALVASGIQEDRVTEVRGYADQQLRNPADPLDASNRRISILLPFRSFQSVELLESAAES